VAQSSARAGELAAWLESSRLWAEQQLERHIIGPQESAPGTIAEVMRYALLGGGKRMRPALVRSATHKNAFFTRKRIIRFRIN
jgi:geranylgeranyl pyrophosphate synthase